MMELDISRKLGSRLGVVLLIFIFSTSGYASSLKTQSIQTLPSLTPSPTSTVGVMATENILLEPPPVSTIRPSNPLATTIVPSEIVQEMLGQIEKEEAVLALRQLTGEEPICINTQCYTIGNRFTGSEGLRWAKDYLHKELVTLGYSVDLQDWSRSGYSDQNLIARKVGTLHPDEEVYLVAHIDGVGKTGGVPFPAADDNASGAADLLEAARVLSKYSFDRTLVFFFSTGEEEGMLGVKSYLNGLSQEDLGPIKYVINVDMVGYDGNRDGVMELWYGDDPKSFALTQMMNETILAYQLDLSPKYIVGCG